MRNKLFLLCLLFLPFLSFSQDTTDEGKTKLGFTLSPNVGWMRVTNSNGSNVTSDGSRAGISYGVLADFGFDRNYYFATGFTITSVNSKLLTTATATNTSPVQTIYKLQYIEIPLTLKLKSNPTDLARFYGQFGLGTGVKISGKESVNDAGNTTSDAANTLRLSLMVGAGAEFTINPGLNIQTGLTLNHGLTNTISSQYAIKSDYLALNLSVFF